MKHSALFHAHRRAGARFIEHFGWELPASFISPDHEVDQISKTVGVADLSYYLKFDLRKRPPQQCWQLGAKHYLIFGEPPLDPPLGAIDVTSVFTSLRLVGPRSRDL